MDSASVDASRDAERMNTFLVHAGRGPQDPGQSLNPVIAPASTFHAGGQWNYARFGSPGAEQVEELIGGIEGGSALVFASGMAAASAVLDLIPAGGTIVIASGAYNGVTARARQLSDLGRLHVREVDSTKLSEVEHGCIGADVLWLESITNPMLHVPNLSRCIEIAHAHQVLTVVDNTLATPLNVQPLGMGADIVMHSITKSLAGHSDLLMGALVTTQSSLWERLLGIRTLAGATPSAFDCYLASRGMRTFVLRFTRMQESARTLAGHLAGHAAIRAVHYPDMGSVVSIEMAGGVSAAEAVCKRTRLWIAATSLGGVESLAERRRQSPIESPTVPEDLVRLSVGIESVADLWADIQTVLDDLT